jgi:hypothetical protein
LDVTAAALFFDINGSHRLLGPSRSNRKNGKAKVIATGVSTASVSARAKYGSRAVRELALEQCQVSRQTKQPLRAYQALQTAGIGMAATCGTMASDGGLGRRHRP